MNYTVVWKPAAEEEFSSYEEFLQASIKESDWERRRTPTANLSDSAAMRRPTEG